LRSDLLGQDHKVTETLVTMVAFPPGAVPIIVDFQMGEIRAIPATTLGARDAAQDHSYLLQVDSDWLVLVAAAVDDKNFC
jgi:hypothetical protein